MDPDHRRPAMAGNSAVREPHLRPMARPARMARLDMTACVVCGEPIPPKRLAALPHTKTCVACSSEDKKQFADLPGTATVQHTGGLHEKYLHEEDVDDSARKAVR